VSELAEQFGGIDIYLFDQLLRGRITSGMTVLEAGAGSGRNLTYFLRAGYQVLAADESAEAVRAERAAAAELAPQLLAENFRVEPVEAMTFPARVADVVISNAVLHFARDDAHFWAMLEGSWRPLRPGGLFFCRLASTVGSESLVHRLDGRRFRLPDGSERYLVDEELLLEATRRLGGELADPLKTTVVHHQRSMTTWVVRKRDVPSPGEVRDGKPDTSRGRRS
jgi:tellurite methyltransferase